MRVASVVLLLSLLVTCSMAQRRSRAPLTREELSVLTDTHFPPLHPKLALPDALKVAERFVAAEKIDISHFWLYQGKFTLFGDPSKPDTDKTPGWYFWWVSDSGGQGNYVEIFVSMDGQCRRLGSM
jgi:hypothetical protein